MKISDILINYAVLSVIVDHFFIKLICLTIFIILFIIKKKSIIYKIDYKRIIEIIMILILNYFITFNLDWLNLGFFGIISVFFFAFKVKIKKDMYYNLYFLLIVLLGVYEFCLNIL